MSDNFLTDIFPNGFDLPFREIEELPPIFDCPRDMEPDDFLRQIEDQDGNLVALPRLCAIMDLNPQQVLNRMKKDEYPHSRQCGSRWFLTVGDHIPRL